jgi:hypothetical protein
VINNVGSSWMQLLLLAACAIALMGTPHAAAVTLNISGGVLKGASGVTVGKKTYSVEFVDGSCISLFSDCSENPANSTLPAFTFYTPEDARAASLALLNQVFLDNSLGQFDTFPNLTQGCSYAYSCTVHTPFAHVYNAERRSYFVTYILAPNFPTVDDPQTYQRTFADLFEFGQASNDTAARWTEIVVVPLPAGAPLMLTGLATLAGLRLWKRQRRPRPTVTT